MPDLNDHEVLLAQNYALQADLDKARDQVALLTAQVASLQADLATRTAERDAARAEADSLRPAPGTVVERAIFRKRLAPAYLRLAGMPPALQAKWDRILGAGGILADFTVVHVDDPVLAALVDAAIADGLLAAEERGMVLAPVQ